MIQRRRYSFREYLTPKVLTVLALGFSSGLPFALVGITFSYWLREENISLAAIGYLSAVNTVYSLKFLWSPIMDRVNAPIFGWLGHRRGWMIVAQIFIAAGLSIMAAVSTKYGLAILTAAALLAAFASASQDIVIDAWRIESAKDKDELGLLTSASALGYRVALLATDSFILIIAQHFGWSFSYFLFAGFVAVGLIAALLAKESPQAEAVLERKEQEAPLWTPRGLFDGIVGPFVAFFKAHGILALLMLLAISLFQVPNFAMGPMAGPLYHDIGLSKDVVGGVRSSAGLIGSFLGVAAGGYVSLKFGFMRALIAGGSALIFGTALYAILPYNHQLPVFTLIMAIDNFGIGMAGVTLVAYMSSLTSLGYTATQYALLTSAYAWVGKLFKIFSGSLVESLSSHFGLMTAYSIFFIGCGLAGIPALLLFGLLRRLQKAD
jgi:MFS transporter, PAT family, beta-lactamase induction signal transducer AmpG